MPVETSLHVHRVSRYLEMNKTMPLHLFLSFLCVSRIKHRAFCQEHSLVICLLGTSESDAVSCVPAFRVAERESRYCPKDISEACFDSSFSYRTGGK